MILKKIKKYLTLKFKIYFISIQDDSLLHNYLEKRLTHLRILIVSKDFIKKNIIARHRMIFSILSEITQEKLYSITLYTYTPIEWKYKKCRKNNISSCFKKQHKR